MRDIRYRNLKIVLDWTHCQTLVQYARIKQKCNFIGNIAQQYKIYIQDDKNDEAKFGEALNIAVMENRIKAAKALIDAGAGKHVKSDSLFRMALKNRCERMVDLLLSYDFELRIKDKKTLIELASARDDWECVKVIATEQKTDIDDKAGYGNVLVNAVCHDRIETAKLLLEAGAKEGLEEKPKESQSREDCNPVKSLMNNFFGLFCHSSQPQDFMGVLENNLKNNCRIWSQIDLILRFVSRCALLTYRKPIKQSVSYLFRDSD